MCIHWEAERRLTEHAVIESIDVRAVNAGAKARRPVLYQARAKIHPKKATGEFRRLKWLIMVVTLVIYYITPWLRWSRGPYAPDQAVLVDMANRRFYFFFVEIWPQEFIYVAGLLVMAGVGLFLVTSVVGRAWCGYTCPQTVWTDLFISIERFFEGDRNARVRLDAAGWSIDKITRRILKHATWIVVAIATGGAWIFYFADSPTLFTKLVTGQAPFIAYATVAVLTATTYVFGGLMREQVCIYMCPWPRIQAAMLDEDSLVVTYNDWRGEPRSRGTKKSASADRPSGDCVDCNACVAVCPTGIDIRDGQQLECITCALCIDACNSVMDKLQRDRGLISYSTLRDYNHNMLLANGSDTSSVRASYKRTGLGGVSDHVKHFRWSVVFRPRTLIYFSVWSAIGLAMLAALLTRDRLQVNVQHDRNPIAVRLSDGSVRNGYTVKLLNMVPEPRVIRLSIRGLPGAAIAVTGMDGESGQSISVPVEPDKLRSLHVFVTQPAQLLQPGQSHFVIQAADLQSNENDTYNAVFELPGTTP
jgi:cytochrome c oxidase accessory protein FixG